MRGYTARAVNASYPHRIIVPIIIIMIVVIIIIFGFRPMRGARRPRAAVCPSIVLCPTSHKPAHTQRLKSRSTV